MNMDLFYVVISCIFVFLLIVGVIRMAIDSRMDYKRKRAIAQKIEDGRGMRLESDDLVLKVVDGKVEILEDVPYSELAAAASPASDTETAPVVPVSETEEVLEELVSRYGEITENSIIFQKSKNLTFADKYNALEENARARYDEFMAYILSKPDCRKSESSVGVTVKNKTDKMLSVTIKRGVVELNFMLTNSELNRLVRAEGIKDIKIKPVVIRLEDDTDLRLAKQTADITLEHLAEEQQYRKEKKKELRRKRNQEMRAAANNTL